MQTLQGNIGGNFYFPKYSISVSQSHVDTIGNLVPIGKITLCYLSGLINTLKLFSIDFVCSEAATRGVLQNRYS